MIRRYKEKLISVILALSAWISLVTTAGIIIILINESVHFFYQVPVRDFLFGLNWQPLIEPKSFGILPLLAGTVMIVFGSAVISLPIGLLTAIYLSHFASHRIRKVIKPVLEILAGIPTVVYGFFALTFVTPVIRYLLPDTEIFNAASASIVVGIMILPTVASLCDDALTSVPRTLKEGGLAIGSTDFEVILGILIPASFSGIISAFILAVSRAFGETMAVTIAAGATPNLTINPFESIQTMTAYIVQVSLGDTPAGGIEYQTIFAVGLVLFITTLFMNIVAGQVKRKYQEVLY